MEEEKIISQALDLAGKAMEFATEKAEKDHKTVRWYVAGTVIVALIFGVTIAVTVSSMWGKYMDKAYSYSQMEQETKTKDVETKQFLK